MERVSSRVTPRVSASVRADDYGRKALRSLQTESLWRAAPRLSAWPLLAQAEGGAGAIGQRLMLDAQFRDRCAC